MNQFSAIDVEESAVAVFEFGDRLEPGETITQASKSAVTVSGTDATPMEVFVGEPQVSGPEVWQRVRGRVADSTYALRMRATTNLGNVIVVAAQMPCIYKLS